MEEIFRGIYRITYKLNQGDVPDVNSYLIKDLGILIDGGPQYPEAYQKLLRELISVNMTIEDINYVILTHHHLDHMGMINFLPSSVNVVADKSVKFYSQKEYKNSVNDFIRQIRVPYEYKSSISDILMDEFLPIDWEKHKLISYSEFNQSNFKFIVSKGHSSLDTIILFNEKFIFTGDILIPKIFFNCLIDISPEDSKLSSFKRKGYLDELETLKKLEFEFLLPGHHDILNKVSALKHIAITINRMNRTSKKVSSAIKKSNSFEDVLKQVYGQFLKYNIFLPFSDVHSILEQMDILDFYLL